MRKLKENEVEKVAGGVIEGPDGKGCTPTLDPIKTEPENPFGSNDGLDG